MVKVIKHQDIDQDIISDIIKIKTLSWDYSFEQHLEWINKNLVDSDFHFLLYKNNELSAYLNLVDVRVKDKESELSFLGIGNVCAKYKGQGDGKQLMYEVNNYLMQNNLNGILFCKKDLLNFYTHNDWKLIKNLHPNPSIFTLVYNYNGTTEDFSYSDRLF